MLKGQPDYRWSIHEGERKRNKTWTNVQKVWRKRETPWGIEEVKESGYGERAMWCIMWLSCEHTHTHTHTCFRLRTMSYIYTKHVKLQFLLHTLFKAPPLSSQKNVSLLLGPNGPERVKEHSRVGEYVHTVQHSGHHVLTCTKRQQVYICRRKRHTSDIHTQT